MIRTARAGSVGCQASSNYNWTVCLVIFRNWYLSQVIAAMSTQPSWLYKPQDTHLCKPEVKRTLQELLGRRWQQLPPVLGLPSAGVATALGSWDKPGATCFLGQDSPRPLSRPDPVQTCGWGNNSYCKAFTSDACPACSKHSYGQVIDKETSMDKESGS